MSIFTRVAGGFNPDPTFDKKTGSDPQKKTLDPTQFLTNRIYHLILSIQILSLWTINISRKVKFYMDSKILCSDRIRIRPNFDKQIRS